MAETKNTNGHSPTGTGPGKRIGDVLGITAGWTAPERAPEVTTGAPGVHAALLQLQRAYQDRPADEPVQLRAVRTELLRAGCTLVASYVSHGPGYSCCEATIQDGQQGTITASSPPFGADDLDGLKAAYGLSLTALLGVETETEAEWDARQHRPTEQDNDKLRAKVAELRGSVSVSATCYQASNAEITELETLVAELRARLQRTPEQGDEEIGSDWDDDDEPDEDPEGELASELKEELAALEKEMSDLRGGSDA